MRAMLHSMQRPRIRDRCYSILCVLQVAVLFLLVNGFAPAAALSGTAPCPANASVATAWCNTHLGGGGGVLTAAQWHSSGFACVCNGATSIHINLDPLPSPQNIEFERPLEDAFGAQLYAQVTDLEGSGSAGSFQVSSASSASSSSFSNESNYTCEWSGTFSQYPDGEQCFPITSVCPTTCSGVPPFVCENQFATQCTASPDGTLLYNCSTCTGRVFSIRTTAPNECSRDFTAPVCDPSRECGGNGCCTPPAPTPNSTAPNSKCECFANSTFGFYTGATCNQCAAGYGLNSDRRCKTQILPVQILLAAIGKTWTMVSPNMAVLILFVIFSVVRKVNVSDRPFELTGMRRANLSTVQVARRRQQSLFHSKYIPMRPAKSRSFANPHQPLARGPSAY